MKNPDKAGKEPRIAAPRPWREAMSTGLEPGPAVGEGDLGSPIFEAMLSRWFEPETEAAAVDANAPATDGWPSDADAGWQAAEAASAAGADELTPAGLPKRRPRSPVSPSEREAIDQPRRLRPRPIAVVGRSGSEETSAWNASARGGSITSEAVRRSRSGRSVVLSNQIRTFWTMRPC